MRQAKLLACLCLAAMGCGITQPTRLAATPSPLPTSTMPVLTPSPTPVIASPAADGRTEGWRSDLELLVPEMDALHPHLDHSVSIDELNAAVADLSAQVPAATDEELLVGVLSIVAMVSASGCDAHTGAFVWGSGTYPLDSLPLRLWAFAEGIFIVDALPPYEDLVGARIDRMSGRLITDVIREIAPVVPIDNDQTGRTLSMRFALIPQILRGLDLLVGNGPVPLSVTSPDKGTRDGEVELIPMADYNAWAGGYGLHLPVDPDVPYLAHIDDALWLDGPNEDGTTFVQYNRVEFLGLGELTVALTDPATERVILDVRHNFGGEVSALDPVVDEFTRYAAANPGTLYVVTGRNTFSAGSLLVARLDADTDAVIVGEPMGGCPTFWGDVEEVHLPYSGIAVSVATTLEVGVDPQDTRLTIEPDLPAYVRAADWVLGIDRALIAIEEATN